MTKTKSDPSLLELAVEFDNRAGDDERGFLRSILLDWKRLDGTFEEHIVRAGLKKLGISGSEEGSPPALRHKIDE